MQMAIALGIFLILAVIVTVFVIDKITESYHEGYLDGYFVGVRSVNPGEDEEWEKRAPEDAGDEYGWRLVEGFKWEEVD